MMRKFILSIAVFLTIIICCFPTVTRAAGVAKVNGVEYATVQEAINAAKNGDTVTLLSDSMVNDAVIIDKSIVIEGERCEIYYTGGYAALIIPYSDGSKHNVTLKNMRIAAKKAERGISYENGGTLTLDDVIIGGYNNEIPFYALYLTLDSSNASININNCSLNGRYGIYIWGQKMTISIHDTKIYSDDYSDTEDYAAIALNSSDIYTAEGTVINITESLIIAKDEDKFPSVAIFNGTLTGEVNVDEQTKIEGIRKEIIAFVETEAERALFFKLQDAINYAITHDKPVEIIRDIIEFDRIIIKGKIIIRGNGFTLASARHEIIDIYTADEVVIENFAIVGILESVYGIIIDNKPVKLTLDNVTISGQSHIALYIGYLAISAEIIIKDCELTGCFALAVYAEGAEVEVIDSKLTGINTENSEDASKYYSGAILIYVNNVKVRVLNGSVSAISSADKPLACIVHVPGNNADNMDVYLDTEIIAEGTTEIIGFDSNSQHVIKVRQEYKQKLNDEGFAVTEPDAEGMIEIDYSKPVFKVTYVVSGNIITVINVQEGDNVANVPAIPAMEGYKGVWDHDGTNITADITINAVYTGNLFYYIKIVLLPAVAAAGALVAFVYYKKKKGL
jgi:hypothetical protein